MKALEDNKSLFFLGALLQVVQMAYIAFFIYTTVMAYFSYSVAGEMGADTIDGKPAHWVGSDSCGYVDLNFIERSISNFQPPMHWQNKAFYFVNLVFLWNIFMGDCVRLFVTSGFSRVACALTFSQQA
jgi:hypothetical protein